MAEPEWNMYLFNPYQIYKMEVLKMLNHYKVVFDVNNKHKKSTWFFFAPNRKMAAKFAIDFVKEEMKLGCYKSIKILSVKKF